jgi:apolipoprotein N-acyltransferase
VKLGAKDVLLALVSGLLMAVAVPLVIGSLSEEPIVATPLVEVLAWFALIPLLSAVDGRRPRSAFWAGWLAGLAYFGVVLHWILVALTFFAHIPYAAAIPILALLVAYCAMYWGLFAAITAYIRGALGTPFTLTAPVVFTALEYVRNYALSGFPWGNIGYTQHRDLAIIQVASITGVYGVAFLLVLSSGLFYEWLAFFYRRRPSRPVVSTAVFAGLVVAAFIWGAVRAGAIENASQKAPRITVSVLQGNIDQGIKNAGHQYRGDIAGIYNRLTAGAGLRGADLIIWPEAAYPVALPRGVPTFAADWSLLRPPRGSPHLLIGAASYYLEGGRRFILNSAVLLDPSLSVLSRYDKVHLVPFGEYVPLGLPLDKIVTAVGIGTPGEGFSPLAFTRNGIDVRLGPMICYEGIFPEISRAFAGGGANLLVNITNDAWYGVSSAPYQHLSMYVFRAIETGRYLARAANTGVSGFIDPYGRILKRSAIFTEDDLSAALPLLDTKTVYTRIGDLFSILASIAAVLMLLAAFSVNRRRPNHD